MQKKFDLIVIGTGSAGTAAAMKCKKAGWEVAIIDSRPFGGTCALRGCDPKKILVGAANIIDSVDRMKGKGITGAPTINWNELMEFKRTFTEPVPENRLEGFQKAGIVTFHGEAVFVAEDKIQVGENELTAEKILIANGAKPVSLPINGAEHLTMSDEFLELDKLPARLVFVGGGYISFEFAHIAARAGSEVHIIHRGKRPLENFEADLVDVLLERSKEVGIHIHLGTEVKSIEKIDSSFKVIGENGSESLELDCDLVLHGAGRVPNIDEMQLEKANVEREPSGITVNEYLQNVSNLRVYAAGDAAATEGLPLTPIASMESHVVASNLLKGNQKTPSYKVMPTVVFTIPKLAAVGLSEDQAKEKGYNYKVKVLQKDISSWYTYKRTNEKHAMVKVIIDEDSDQILGAHLIGQEADELINHFALAIQFNLTTYDLKQMIFAYPTAASDIASML